MVRILTLLLVLTGVPVAFGWGLARVQIETDMLSAMPEGDAVLASARRILGRHPALDRVTLDLGLLDGPADPDRLLAAAQVVEARLEDSDLFTRVGLGQMSSAGPALFARVIEELPSLFDQDQLREQVAQRLTPAAVRRALQRNLTELSELSGLGQAEAMAHDPLRLRELVLARLAPLNPAPGSRLYRGRVISADDRHLLLVADPHFGGGDTKQGRALTQLLASISKELPTALGPGPEVRLTAVGAYRAALDNETVVRADTQRAVWVATIGIALLLLLTFPRPWLGLLALVPALAGASLALLIYSFLEPKISALALGFGGALIAITVDHGIAYLQFLDRRQATSGRQAAREVWSVGLFAALTTVGAFLTLYLSGFAMLGQVGLFAALGIGCAFLFVHTVFPVLFPRLSGARRGPLLPVGALLSRLGRRRGLFAAGLYALVVIGLFVAGGRPVFSADLNAMNTVRPETLAAERLVADVWGDVFKRTYVMLEAEDLPGLRTATDRLADLLDEQIGAGVLSAGFSPSVLLPGLERAERNRAAWRTFFNAERRAAVVQALSIEGQALGFAEHAFADFARKLDAPKADDAPPNGALLELLGFAGEPGSGYVWLGAVEPGAAYDPLRFCERASSAGVSVFDPALFTARLSALLGDSFVNMLIIVGLAVLGLLVILFFDWLLVIVTALPLVLSLIGTLGVLGIAGRPLDIPALMLAIVVLGMGVDYALFFVRGQQRYFKPEAESLEPIRMAVFLAAGSTMVGLGTLALADHAVPRSAGLTTLLGVGFCLLGTFALLPPLLNRLFAARPFVGADLPVHGASHRRLVRTRYAHLEPGVRLFARLKMVFDPMFPRLHELVGPARRILDLGCGYGLPAAWLLAVRPEAEALGLEPDGERARVAARVLGDRGRVVHAAAPDMGLVEGPFDAILLLDVIHHLTDDALAETLAEVAKRLSHEGRLILRADVPAPGRFAWERALESLRLRIANRRPVYRSRVQLVAALERAGLACETVEASAATREETWFVARRVEASS